MQQNVFATYSTDFKLKNYVFIHRLLKNKLVELSGIEPLTSCVQGRRSPS